MWQSLLVVGLDLGSRSLRRRQAFLDRHVGTLHEGPDEVPQPTKSSELPNIRLAGLRMLFVPKGQLVISQLRKSLPLLLWVPSHGDGHNSRYAEAGEQIALTRDQ